MKKEKESSEFEIQSYIHASLLLMGIDIRGEVRTRKKTCRFDLVVFVNKRPVQIIEVKKVTKKMIKKGGRAKYTSKLQRAKYNCYGLPVKYIHGMDEAKDYVEKVRLTRKEPSDTIGS